ncbi:Hsp33 family molecular chaperone HslO [Methylomonas sp. AM2-LC]|uniref:Hsp33 family molecular chaperone HslO n=1 Tax=Methylomonas sp. AM2-LC TaxID=3153301 RepID=UPI0032634B3E
MKQQDCLIRFLFADQGVRGEWVRLQDSWQQAKQYQILASDGVETQLGEALAAVVLLSATIKFNGTLIMQLQGSGELRALVAQSSHDRKIRGLVRSETSVVADNLKAMLGEGGRLVITVETENADPYQGIVGIEHDSLAEVLKVYFNQSEQLDTCLWLVANKTHAAGLFLQVLPGDSQDKLAWEHLETLASTITSEELLHLDCEELLHRLFNQEKVVVYQPEAVEFKCGCSRSKISGTLLTLGRAELESILAERQTVEVDCQFCGAQYHFDKIDVEDLLTNPLKNDNSFPPTCH